MSFFRKIPLLIFHYWGRFKFHLLESDNLIINWSNFDKGVLLCFFGAFCQLSALKWYLFSCYSEENRVWINHDFFITRITTLFITLGIFIGLIALSHRYKRNEKFRQFITYFSPMFFGGVMIYAGYTVGMFSPATISGFINIVLIGLVYYPRKIIYSIAVFASIFTMIISYLTFNGVIRYAPVFSDALTHSEFYHNPFWIKSMAEVYLPILLVSFLFFEILLSQWRRREMEIKKMSQTDALTNVFNRRYIGEELSSLESKKKATYAVVLLDLDYFKKINDDYGHETGDAVLQRVATILCTTTRIQDVVGRFGGEEFILILKDQNLQQAIEIAERCRKIIEQEEFELETGEILKTSASFGVALSQANAKKEHTIRMADRALYLAKQKGRNQVRHYLELNLKPAV
ncbi:GGDEF domain-containing protein [Acinetobacter sp. SM34]|uniref:GGDEF domain-containing protein n=1 Tax=Acinetobacter sp. SM34 TaxID=1301620 RepID=UPI001EDA2795|nr:GGDEF domain-containing protein [Acinetobacter sp. SM34]MCG2607069.1 GGDEF domain-containing protein [Acinetobacter sp. SM34]